MKNKVLVTGGSGFIGSHFIELLISKKFKVINLDIVKNKFFEKNISHSNYTFIKCNICSENKIQKIFKNYKLDYIVNFAAESHVDKSIDGAKKFFDTNVLGTLNLLENTRKFNAEIRFLQISTDEVFGSLGKNDRSFTINNKFKPNSPYSASKASADHLVRSYRKTYGINASSIHSSNNFGERQNPEKLIPMVLTALNNKKLIPLYGNGKNIRDWIYVKDNCRAVFEVMKYGAKGKNYLIGGNNEISNINLIKKIIFHYGKSLKKTISFKDSVLFVNDRFGHDYRYSVNTKNIVQELKFKFKKTFDHWLQLTIKHYINNNNYYKKLSIKNKWFHEKYKKYRKKVD
jgi:dTDP-glucose 4,6-dehydratase